MNTSENIELIAKALNLAQKEMGGAKKSADNPFYKSKYSDFNSVLEAVKEPLNNNGITILQPHRTDNESHFVETILLHESGQFIGSNTPIFIPEKKKNDPQALGSAITYARRYGLQSLVSIPAEDDDGEKAMVRKPTPAPVAKSGMRRSGV